MKHIAVGRESIQSQDIDDALDIVRRLKRPFGDQIIGLKACHDNVYGDDGNVLLYMTEAHQEYTNWVRVIWVGPDVKYIDPEWFVDYEVYMVFPEKSNWSYNACGVLFFCREAAMDDDKHGEPPLKPFVALIEKGEKNGN